MNMDAMTIYRMLVSQGIRLTLTSGGDLRVLSNRPVPEGAREMIRQHKTELTALVVRTMSSEPTGDTDIEGRLDALRKEHLRLFLAGQVPACRELEQKIERLEAELAILQRSGPEVSRASTKLDEVGKP